ncbi:phosphotransferase [Rhizohabitans arisaemae]|uniref:phosphotransferase n=1 Tax=Rhizohabitans arisaemae TaxID=2720610 RepID=UPI0024B195EA|nr:phosphotransferase [Rhizohabitans arisaemae]
MPHSIEEIVEMVAAWAGTPVKYRQIKGGLSHRIGLVETLDHDIVSATEIRNAQPRGTTRPARTGDRQRNGHRWLLRVLDPEVASAGLGIPLEQEILNTGHAAVTGVGAQIVHRLPGVPALLLEYIDGQTLDAASVGEPRLIPDIAAACRKLHAGPRFVNDFSIFRKLDELLGRCRKHGLGIPDGYLDRLPQADEIERVLRARPAATVPCHNDLLPENFILQESPRRVRIVDYQLSGNNDHAFELGDVAAEARFDDDQVEQLVYAYHGGYGAGYGAGFDRSAARDSLDRTRLNAIMSNFTWTLWFSVHHGLLAGKAADADFDYAQEAADKWARAVQALDDPGFGRLIDEVRRA